MKKIYILIIIIILCSIIYYFFNNFYYTPTLEKFGDGSEIYNDIFQPDDEPDSTNLMREASTRKLKDLKEGEKVSNETEIKLQPKCDNKFFEKNSFCQLNNTKDKCVCKFQKDDIASAFNSPEICCEKLCNEIPPDKCLENNEFTEIPYYCNIGGVCKEYKGTVVSSHISANMCGTDPLNNQLLLPYASKAECETSLTVCDKYNDPNNTYHLNKANCLKNTNCGFCINEYGYGKCIEGTPEGPLDLNKYYYCNPNVKNKNSYKYGDHALYIV